MEAKRVPGNDAEWEGGATKKERASGRLQGGGQSAGGERKEAERNLLCLKGHERFPPPLSPVGAELPDAAA